MLFFSNSLLCTDIKQNIKIQVSYKTDPYNHIHRLPQWALNQKPLINTKEEIQSHNDCMLLYMTVVRKSLTLKGMSLTSYCKTVSNSYNCIRAIESVGNTNEIQKKRGAIQITHWLVTFWFKELTWYEKDIKNEELTKNSLV